jgi:hypothetical protein
VHRVIGPVATLNIANALLQGHGLTGRPRGHVGKGERVHDWTVLNRKGGQHLDQAALLGLKARPRVMSDQTSQPLLAVGAKEPGAVHGMEAEPIQGGSVAHVMRGRGRAGSACGLKATTNRVQRRGDRLAGALVGGGDRPLADGWGVAGGHALAVAGKGFAQRRSGAA